MNRSRRGDTMKFKILVERYKKPAYYYALSMVGNTDDAYDLSQEAFIRAYKALDRYDNKRSFRNWFFAILSNLCKNALRSSAVRKKHLTSEKALVLAPASTDKNPEAQYIREETKKMVWDALATLDEEAREIIILKHFQDMSYADIAEVLRIPKGSVMSRLYYARRKLKKAIEVME